MATSKDFEKYSVHALKRSIATLETLPAPRPGLVNNLIASMKKALREKTATPQELYTAEVKAQKAKKAAARNVLEKGKNLTEMAKLRLALKSM